MKPIDRPTETVAQVEVTPEFKRNVRQLAKRYRHIRSDIQPLIEQLEKGETPGDRVSSTGEDCVVFKVRLRCSDIQKGKSGGYRIIYWLTIEGSVVLITIYSKSDQGNISANNIRRIVARYDEQTTEADGAGNCQPDSEAN